jgi:hypothetical protein
VALRFPPLEVSDEAAALLSDEQVVHRLAVQRYSRGASGMPWKSWREVPPLVRERYVAEARTDLAAILGGEEEHEGEVGGEIAAEPRHEPVGGAAGGSPLPTAAAPPTTPTTEALF